ncbi:Nit protein [Nadsonia fulvescens var. elongata DSM 6958]|uniref:Nit protein n=1 Tax=Nadsonia fulvescens var. elongata DSM 6958 TaxID=857566 RepID=A0A1E3PG54_9ASCO|nr:Nit protein [Nadsonia fulvescens var. elongata DSM 6958]
MVLTAVGQFCATNNIYSNATVVCDLIQRASAMGAKCLFLPEASDYIAGSSAESLELVRSPQAREFVERIQEAVRQLPKNKSVEVSVGIHEIANTVCVDHDKQRLKNVLLWIDSNGEVKKSYQKVHLFDVDVPNGPILRESLTVEPGTEIVPPIDTAIGKVGLAICYDIRFPEMAMRLRSLGAQVLAFPSAFTVRTGMAHWEVLARARAIDNQCYVIMPGLVGKHDLEGKRQSWGHSIIVDPWGTILAQAPDTDAEPRIIVADIDHSVTKKVRENMPLWEQRRPDVFGYQV